MSTLHEDLVLQRRILQCLNEEQARKSPHWRVGHLVLVVNREKTPVRLPAWHEGPL